MVIPITTAAIVAFHAVDFSKFPGAFAYISLYLAILIGTGAVVLTYRNRIYSQKITSSMD